MADLAAELHAKLQLMTRISTLLNSSLERQEVVDNALLCVEQVVEAETCSIFGVDRERGDLYFVVARGAVADKLQGLRLEMGEGIAGWVALTEQPLIVADVHQDSRFHRRFDALSGFTTRSILCVPLKSKDQLLGVLEIINKKDGGAFDEDDLETMLIVANQIGIAWDNARLYRQLQERLDLAVEELKVTRGKLFQAERLAALGKLARGVAHEVRNPVMIIGGFTHKLQKRLPADDPAQTALAQIVEAAQRLERMVNEVEAFCALPEPVMRPTSLAAVVKQALEVCVPQLQEQRITVRQEMPATLPPLAADAGLLSEALCHLIHNACEAMPGGGELRVSVHLEPTRVAVMLTDTGEGVSTEDLPHLFDPFFSTKPQGTGMGLARVYRIVAGHNGDLQIASEPGRGTTVRLWLPRWQPEE